MDADVRSALAQARALGFLGPGPLEAHEASAQLFLAALGELEGPALDLGSGGGVPGLLLAASSSSESWVLLDGHRRRTSFLAAAVGQLGWGGRVTVVRERAEVAAHDPRYREEFATVVSRSFGTPQVTAECAAGFLRVNGRLAVAEPPGGGADRWETAGLLVLGLERSERADTPVSVFRKSMPSPEAYPRASGVQRHHPLW